MSGPVYCRIAVNRDSVRNDIRIAWWSGSRLAKLCLVRQYDGSGEQLASVWAPGVYAACSIGTTWLLCRGDEATMYFECSTSLSHDARSPTLNPRKTVVRTQSKSFSAGTRNQVSSAPTPYVGTCNASQFEPMHVMDY